MADCLLEQKKTRGSATKNVLYFKCRKNISMSLHSKAGVYKNIVSAKIFMFTFLVTPAQECNLSEIFLQTPALECIFDITWSLDTFAGTTSTTH